MDSPTRYFLPELVLLVPAYWVSYQELAMRRLTVFTLFELLVVIAIISLLLQLLLPA